jgi:hypothetical protein
MAQEGAGIHIEQTDGDDEAWLVRIVDRDIHVVRFVRGPMDEPSTGRRVRAQAPTALWGRLVTWRAVGIPEAALARRGQMTGGNAERGIPMIVEVAVIPVRPLLIPLRPVLLLLFVLFALVAVRFIFPRISHGGDRHDGGQE